MMPCLSAAKRRDRCALRRAARLLAIILCVALIGSGAASAAPGQPLREKYDVSTGPVSNSAALGEYATLLQEYEKNGYAPGEGSYRFTDWNDVRLEAGLGGYAGAAFLWDQNTASLSMTVTVEKSGLYVLALDWLPFADDVSLIQRGVQIDGKSVCADSETCLFFRQWEEKGTVTTDTNGDEKAPGMQQICTWQKQYIYDTNALYARPLEFYLSAGTHTVTLTHVSGKMAVGALTVEGLPQWKSYADYHASHTAAAYSGEPLTQEAEDFLTCSDRTIRRLSDADPATTPFTYSKLRLNTVGGERWKSSWQSITWECDVPETGLYQISLRVLQNTGEGLTVYRQLMIDGEVPFEEALAVPFPYASRWQTVTLGGDEPFAFYLEKGKHRLSLRVVAGELSETVSELKRASADLASLLMDINTVVGAVPDANFDYELDKKISWLMPTLQSIRDTLKTQSAHLHALSGRQTTMVSNIDNAATELDGYLRDSDSIPTAAGSDGSLTVMQTNLSSWYSTLLETPITLDTLILSAPNTVVKHRSSTIWQRIKAGWLNFWASFHKDYNSMSTADGEAEERTISVWIARGREWGELLQQMADEEYTPQSGVRVQVNILPSGSVGAIGGVSPILLSLVADNSPNVAIGSDSSTPVELAIRDSVVELSSLPGYKELASTFVDGVMEPLGYNGGVYALPETMDFQFLFYRKDIMEKLKLSVPEDWDTLYGRLLPSLKQNNYNFYIPITTSTTATYQYCAFYTYLWQRGGEIYDESGLQTLLDSNIAYAAFDQWVQNYTQYNLPREINVFNHFRTGDIPIFVGGLNDYLTLKVAAPELYGKWGIARIPGTRREDGTLDRSAIGAMTTCMMFDKGERENADAWDFLRWYMSADVQYRYGEDIEASVGLQARWFTANTTAFSQLSWDRQDLAVFESAMRDMRNPRNVLGGYITGRQLNNAWTRAVMSGQDAHEALEDAVKEIRRELLRKQNEYGIGGESSEG